MRATVVWKRTRVAAHGNVRAVAEEVLHAEASPHAERAQRDHEHQPQADLTPQLTAYRFAFRCRLRNYGLRFKHPIRVHDLETCNV